jgi:hypothetical protein
VMGRVPWRPLGRPGFGCFGCISVFFGVAAGGSAFTAGHFYRRLKVTKTLGPCVRPSQARVPSFRDRSGRSGYGLLRCTYVRCVWLRQTVAALPRPDQSLHSACRWGRLGKIKSTRAALIVEWLEAGGWLWVCGVATPHPSPLPLEREPILVVFNICIRLDIACWRAWSKQLDRFPLPPGEG